MSKSRFTTEQRGADRGRVQTVPPGYRIPKHGGGMLKPFLAGNAGRPPNISTRYSETLALARAHSPDAMQTLIQRLKDPDGRIAVVAANSILERAFGRVREAKPEDQAVEQHVDLTQLTAAELAILVKLADSGRLGTAPIEAPPQIEGSAEPDGG
jgi:hypothetical protein